ncbi:MAG: flagellar basal body protein FliL, partial [Desulfocapsaceae bacterium]|nr:flagellar basal body protein FliL [Desulfocapsaceae bacterium]
MADKKDANKAEDTSTDQGSRKKKLIIIGGAALLLIIILGVTAFFLLKKSDSSKESSEKSEAAVQVPGLNPPAAIGPMIEIKEFIVNIISEVDRNYVKASLTIELVNNPTVV